MREPGKEQHREMGGRANNRAENPHLTFRRPERKMQRFRSLVQAPCFVSIHSAIYNTCNIQRPLISRKTMRIFRSAPITEWNAAFPVA